MHRRRAGKPDPGRVCRAFLTADMKEPDLPQDEQKRLEALRALEVLDTPSEERFDRLTRMAKRMFDVPIALVSLVDQRRQWFKSCIGLDVRETPRSISFCGHAILGEEILVIPDTSKDLRFADNPLVLDEPHIRFYAGCPLTVMETNRVGTLCIIDRAPRALSEEDAVLLRDLAAMVEKELTAALSSTLDELTGISNRRGLMAVANRILPLCTRNGIPATLAYFDLDGFKRINERFGQAEGDMALKTFAQQLELAFRDSDCLARLGGDEFAVLMTGAAIEQSAAKIEKFRAALASGSATPYRGYPISFSHGLVEFKLGVHHSIDGLLADADYLMYERKREK